MLSTSRIPAHHLFAFHGVLARHFTPQALLTQCGEPSSPDSVSKSSTNIIYSSTLSYRSLLGGMCLLFYHLGSQKESHAFPFMYDIYYLMSSNFSLETSYPLLLVREVSLVFLFWPVMLYKRKLELFNSSSQGGLGREKPKQNKAPISSLLLKVSPPSPVSCQFNYCVFSPESWEILCWEACALHFSIFTPL